MKPPPLLHFSWTRQSRKKSLSGMSLPQQANEGVLLSPQPSSLISKGLQFGMISMSMI
ncbi:Hypothetical protein FKW44_022019 [Caligus rogercresseyi]|uniref:Uncharacterized protein n=1 Tax=Caligus rogercresseyi TaxID=217165 RepID=A0A7T8GSB0_CALRO|nr:Hypothetical protein FKW44_022019 [Caligus rogercresseyi]